MQTHEEAGVKNWSIQMTGSLSPQRAANVNLPAMGVSHFGSESSSLTWPIPADAASTRKAIPVEPCKYCRFVNKIKIAVI